MCSHNRRPDTQEFQSAIDVAVIEQAKGILMERHAVGIDRAFEMLREHSQRGGRKVADVSAAIVESHHLLPSVGAENSLR